MKNILLVSPSRNYPMANEMYPSGALLLLGTMLRKQGHNVRVVHMVADKVDRASFQGILRQTRPDIVGFTVSTYQTRMTKLLSLDVKVYNDRILTVAGGAHPSALGGKFLRAFPEIDVAVYGEGEMAITDIARDVSLRDVYGIHYGYHQHDGKWVTNPPPFPRAGDTLDALPLPDKSLIDFKRYLGLFPVGRRPCMFVMSSRGCPYQCSFCSKSVYGNTLRLRSPESIVEEVELLYRDWGIREIHFGDDTFNANRAWAGELLDLVIKRGFHRKLVFRVALRVNEEILDMELLRHLKAAGVWFIYYGVENGDQDMLDRMHKGITVAEVERAFKMTHDVGLKTEAFFIIGLPGETRETIQASRDLYKRIRPYWGGFSRALPFPGTAFTAEAEREGHLLSKDYGTFGPGTMAVRTDALTGAELEQAVVSANRMADFDKMKHPKQMAYAIKDRTYRRIGR
ncbi:MAG: B12-binding domain-containing radical SAM protein [Candidatus Bathyanammoxibius sp.]